MSFFYRLVFFLLVLGACSADSHRQNEPWARSLTEADRVAWGQICAGNFEHSLLGEGPSRVEAYTYTSIGSRSSSVAGEFEFAYPKAKCQLVWHPRTERVLSLTVRLTFDSVPAVAEVEPYLQLITQELPNSISDDVAAIMRATIGQPLLSTRVGEFSIGGGFDHMNGWMMNVTLVGAP